MTRPQSSIGSRVWNASWLECATTFVLCSIWTKNPQGNHKEKSMTKSSIALSNCDSITRRRTPQLLWLSHASRVHSSSFQYKYYVNTNTPSYAKLMIALSSMTWRAELDLAHVLNIISNCITSHITSIDISTHHYTLSTSLHVDTTSCRQHHTLTSYHSWALAGWVGQALA